MSTLSTLFTSSSMKTIASVSEAELFVLPSVDFLPPHWSQQKSIAIKNLVIGFVYSHTGILLHESINYIALEYDEFQLWISSEATQAWKDWWRSAAIATSSQGPSRIKFSNINITYWKNLLLGIHKEWLKIKTKGPKRIRSASLEATPEIAIGKKTKTEDSTEQGRAIFAQLGTVDEGNKFPEDEKAMDMDISEAEEESDESENEEKSESEKSGKIEKERKAGKENIQQRGISKEKFSLSMLGDGKLLHPLDITQNWKPYDGFTTESSIKSSSLSKRLAELKEVQATQELTEIELLESYAFDLKLGARLEQEQQCLIAKKELELLNARCQTQQETLDLQQGKIEKYEKDRILLATELQRQIGLERKMKEEIIGLKAELEKQRKKEEERVKEERKLDKLISTVKKEMEEFGI